MLWLWYSPKSRPAKKAALNSVVANCEMPPPTSSVNTPSSMTRRVHEPLLRGAPADDVVDRERLARLDDMPRSEVGDAVDVGHPRLAAVGRGEGRDTARLIPSFSASSTVMWGRRSAAAAVGGVVASAVQRLLDEAAASAEQHAVPRLARQMTGRCRHHVERRLDRGRARLGERLPRSVADSLGFTVGASPSSRAVVVSHDLSCLTGTVACSVPAASPPAACATPARPAPPASVHRPTGSGGTRRRGHLAR